MDRFHVVRLSADALDECRRRIQREIPGRRGRKSDPLYTARRTLNASVGFFTAKQAGRLTALFTDDARLRVEATWGVYQRMIAAYRHKDRAVDKMAVNAVIKAVRTGVPSPLIELIKLGRP